MYVEGSVWILMVKYGKIFEEMKLGDLYMVGIVNSGFYGNNFILSK